MAMELCASPAISNPQLRPNQALPLRTAITSRSAHFSNCSTNYILRYRHFSTSLLRAAASDDSNGYSPLFAEKRDGVTVLEDSPSASSVDVKDSSTEPIEEESKEETEEVEQEQAFELSKDLSLESVDAYSVALYGSGAFFGLWLVSAIVGAVDSVPLVPKLLEVVGLGYTVWFTARFLLFKESREELAAKIDEVKEHVIG